MSEQEGGAAPTFEQVRQRRRTVAAAAARLRALDDGAARRLSEKVSWADMASLPSWCLMPDRQRTRLQGVCGALYCLPNIVGSLDGRYLKRWRLMLGDAVFEEILTARLPVSGDTHVGESVCDGDPGDSAASGGAAVLLGTLDNPYLRALFAPLLGPSAPLAGSALGAAIHRSASDIVQRHPGSPDAPATTR